MPLNEPGTPMVRVLEVDQWTSTGDVASWDFPADVETMRGRVRGGDSGAAARIFGGRFFLGEVPVSERPSRGYVWFIEDPITHKCKFYKANYDSSD